MIHKKNLHPLFPDRIRQAVQIVVMDKHKIVDVGKHDTLVEKSSKYQELIKRQSVLIRDVSMRGMEQLGILDEDEEGDDGEDV